MAHAEKFQEIFNQQKLGDEDGPAHNGHYQWMMLVKMRVFYASIIVEFKRFLPNSMFYFKFLLLTHHF